MAQYIERAKVTDALIDNTSIVGSELEEAVNAICAIPAADVVPVVRGKWESHGEGFKWVYICSVCGFVDGHPMNDRMHFCPNCGAKMEES